jgi:hypothetical protein
MARHRRGAAADAIAHRLVHQNHPAGTEQIPHAFHHRVLIGEMVQRTKTDHRLEARDG